MDLTGFGTLLLPLTVGMIAVGIMLSREARARRAAEVDQLRASNSPGSSAWGGSGHATPRRGYSWLFFSLSGRLSRKAYWGASLITGGASWSGLVFGGIVDRWVSYGLGIWVAAIILMAASVGGLFVQGKRFHDRGKSAAWILIALIPLVGTLWIIIELGFIRGVFGPNRFGSDPLLPTGWATASSQALTFATGAHPPGSPVTATPGQFSGWNPTQPQPALFVPALLDDPSAGTISLTPPAWLNRFASEPAVTGGSDAHTGCAVCGHAVGADDRFCRGCGSQQPAPPSRCPACDQVAPVGDRFCTECGAGLAV